METRILYSGLYWGYSPPKVDRIWGIWGSYYTTPQSHSISGRRMVGGLWCSA